MNQTKQTPLQTTSNKTMAAPVSSPITQRTSIQEVAANLSNNAARLYAHREYDDALVLYKQSISLLNEMMFCSQDTNMQNAADRNLSEIVDFTQTIEIPLDSAYDCEVKPCSDEFISVAVMYNIFLLLRKTGRTIEALRFLELVHSVTEAGADAGAWHPTFKLAIQYHLATLAYDCGESDESWRIFMQAIEMGRKHLSHHTLYATVCTHMGRRLLDARCYDEAQALYQEAITVYEHFSTEEIDLNDAPSEAFAAAAA
jgi:tetratricopeptide (TPR) repeat protein